VRVNQEWLGRIVHPSAEIGFSINKPFLQEHSMLLNDVLDCSRRGYAIKRTVIRNVNLAFGEGDFETAFSLLEFVCELAEELRSQPNIYAAVSGKEWSETVCRLIFGAVLSENNLSSDQLKRLDALLPKEQLVRDKSRGTLPAVRARLLSMVQWMHFHGRLFDNAWFKANPETFRCTRFRRCVRWNDVLRDLNELFDNIDQAIESDTPVRSWSVAEEELARFNLKYESASAMSLPGYNEHWEWIRGGDFTPLVAVAVSPDEEMVDAVVRAPLREIASIRVARIAIRIRAYRDEHGTIPGELSDVMNIRNWEVPASLFEDPFTNRPLKYSVTKGRLVIRPNSSGMFPNKSMWAQTVTPVERQWTFPIPMVSIR